MEGTVKDWGMLKILLVIVIGCVLANIAVKWSNKEMTKYRIRKWLRDNPGKAVPQSIMLGLAQAMSPAQAATAVSTGAATITTDSSTATASQYGANTGIIPQTVAIA